MNIQFAHIHLHAYMDGELTEAETIEFEQILTNNPALKTELCELRHNKQKLAHYYKKIQPPKPNLPHLKPRPNVTRMVASLLLGALLGATSLYSVQTIQPEHITATATNPTAPSQPNFVVHLDTNQPDKLAATLEKARFILDSTPGANVEIITNHEGIQLFDASQASAAQIKQLLSQYDNLSLMACQRTVERLEKTGEPFTLLQKVRADSPAVDEVVHKLQQGWTYIKI